MTAIVSGRPGSRRVGLFGGAFDPPHLAHVALARCAIQQLNLDVLHVLPTGQAWHRAAPTSPAPQRVEMARLAFAGIAGLLVDPREARRSGPTYTADTLDGLRSEYPQAEFFLCIGADQARNFEHWQRWAEIAVRATICVAQRDQFTPASGYFAPQVASRAQILGLDMPLMDVSSSSIRSRVQQGLGLAHLVAEPVARYIEHHQLYRTT